MIQVSVIIVSYNVKYLLQQCIQSVLQASENLNVEIIVVDNCSTDGTCTELKEKFREVQFVENKENIGFSKANNQGVALASGTYVLILNPDTVIAEDTLIQLLDFAENQTNLGMVGVKLIDGTGSFLPESKRSIPTPWVSFNKVFGLFKSQSKLYYAEHLGEDKIGKVPILVGAFMFLKKSVYEEVKGFDEDYFMYGEDIDLSYKVLKKGYDNFYFPKTQVIHYKGESTQQSIRYLNYFLGAMRIFYKKHFRANSFFNLFMEVGAWSWYLLKCVKNLFVSDKKKLNTTKTLVLSHNQDLLNSFTKTSTSLESNLDISSRKLAELIKEEKIDELVFDNDFMNNQIIIKHMQLLKDQQLAFTIKPKNANFLVTSAGSRFKCQVRFL